jgi:uncharacterized protein YwgA
MRRIRTKVGEEITPTNVKKVISLLERETNPISKKEACEILHISYNTTRLNKIIEDFKEREVYVANRRKQLHLKPIEEYEVKEIVESYLAGDSLSKISENVYRSIAIVKMVLEEFNLPIRNKSYSYFDPVFLEKEEMISSDYKDGDLVFSARYNCPALVKKLVQNSDIHGNVYKIWLYGDYNQWAAQPYYELSDLRKVQKLGVKLPDYTKEEMTALIIEGFKKAKRISDD